MRQELGFPPISPQFPFGIGYFKGKSEFGKANGRVRRNHSMKNIRKNGLGMVLAPALALWIPCASAQQRTPAWNESLRWDGAPRQVAPTAPRPAAATAPLPATAWESAFEPPVMSTGFGEGWIADRLTLGLAIRQSHLTDNHRSPDRDGGKTFVGYVNELDMNNETLVVPVLTYWAARYLRLSATWENLKAKTYNYDPDNPYGHHLHSDGRLKLEGPVFVVEGLWPLWNDTVFPHVGAGLFIGMGDFLENDFWHYGYATQEDYDAFGRPKKARSYFLREIRVDDAIGWLLSAGVAWRPFKHFQVDLDVRQMWVEPDCVFGYTSRKGKWDPQVDGEFTLDNLTWTLSAAYVF